MQMKTSYWGKWGKATTCGNCHPHWPKALPWLRRKITSCVGASSTFLKWLLRPKQVSGNLLCCYYTAQTVHLICEQMWMSLWDYAKDIKRGAISSPDLRMSWLRFHYHEICLKISAFPIGASCGVGFPFLLTSEPWINKSFLCKPKH